VLQSANNHQAGGETTGRKKFWRCRRLTFSRAVGEQFDQTPPQGLTREERERLYAALRICVAAAAAAVATQPKVIEI
jgi:hypothetical protein